MTVITIMHMVAVLAHLGGESREPLKRDVNSKYNAYMIKYM